MSKNKNVPELRFKEFSDEENLFVEYSFNDIFIFSTGKNIKQNEASPEFLIPCVRYGELYHMYNEVIKEVINKTNLDKSELRFSDGDEILLPSAGEDPLDIGSASALTIKNVAIGRTINILKPAKDNVYSQIYVSYYINQKLRNKISSLAKGVSISNVYNSDLRTLEIKLPSVKEQTKITSFLTCVDDKLQTLKKKKALLEKYKKGVMQKIFSQELRFKDEKGNDFPEWEEKKMGEICEIKKGEQLNVSELIEGGEYPALNGGINPSGFTNKWNSEANTISISEGGNSCGFVNLLKQKFWSGGHCYTLLNINSLIENLYLFQVLKYYQSEIMKLRVGSGLPNIQKKDLNNFSIPIPNIEEQSKISSFLSSIDDKINQTQFQIVKTESWKKGLLQKMFI